MRADTRHGHSLWCNGFPTHTAFSFWRRLLWLGLGFVYRIVRELHVVRRCTVQSSNKKKQKKQQIVFVFFWKQELQSLPTAAFVRHNRICHETWSVALCNVTSQVREQFISSYPEPAHCKQLFYNTNALWAPQITHVWVTSLEANSKHIR